MRRFAFLIGVVIFLIPFDLKSQMDLSFNHLLKNFNGEVKSIVADSVNNRLYVGGSFTTYGGAWNEFEIFDPENNFEPSFLMPRMTTINQICSDNNGGWFVAGTSIEGYDDPDDGNYNLIHVKNDLTIEYLPPLYTNQSYDENSDRYSKIKIYGDWFVGISLGIVEVFNWHNAELLYTSQEIDGAVSDFFVDGDKIYLSGKFSEVDGQPRLFFCQLDADTFELTDWLPEYSAVPCINYSTGTGYIMGMSDSKLYLSVEWPKNTTCPHPCLPWY